MRNQDWGNSSERIPHPRFGGHRGSRRGFQPQRQQGASQVGRQGKTQDGQREKDRVLEVLQRKRGLGIIRGERGFVYSRSNPIISGCLTGIGPTSLRSPKGTTFRNPIIVPSAGKV